MDAKRNVRATPAASSRPRAPRWLRTVPVAVTAVLAILSLAAPAGADPGTSHIAAESAVYCPRTGTVNFTLTFDRRPKLTVLDAYGRQQDTFQYYVVGDATQPYPDNYDAIVRGPEIQLTGSTGSLPIRSPSPSDPDPAATGWGPTRAIVPVRLSGRVLTFSAPLSAVSDRSTDGTFSYVLETYAFGETVDHVDGQSVVGAC